MRPKKLTLVMEQTLGHVSFTQNLRTAFDSDNEVKVNWLPIPYFHQKWWEKLPLLRSNWSFRGSLKAWQAVHAQDKVSGQPDLYLFHTQVISLLLSSWLRDKSPIIISMDATPLNYDQVGVAYGHNVGNPLVEKFKLWLNRRAFHAATYLITWSEWARQSLVQDYGVSGHKIEVIPPGTNLSFWQYNGETTKPAHPEGKICLLFVGGDFERKGGKLLYECFCQHLAAQCELHLVTTSEVAEANGVFVYRNIPPNSPQLKTLFQQADVFVLPTEGDCLPISITEAMAAGLPVVSTNVGAIPEVVIEGETGFIIPPGNGTELLRALTALVSNENLRRKLGQKGRERAELMFDASKNGQRFLSICKSLATIQN